jgi:hypothetical protein
MSADISKFSSSSSPLVRLSKFFLLSSSALRRLLDFVLVTSLPPVCTGAEKVFAVLAMLRIRNVGLCVAKTCSIVGVIDVSENHPTSVFSVDMRRVLLQTSKLQHGSIQFIHSFT